MFHATVDDNHKLSDVEKFSYLRNIVSGAAAEAIAGLSLTHKNYSVACDLLREKFGDEQAILSAHYRALVNLPYAYNNAISLRAFYNEVETHVRSLDAAGRDAHQELFIPLITSKLPKDT